MSHTSNKAKTTTKVTVPFVVEVTFAQVKPAKLTCPFLACYGSAASRFQVPQVAPKEERRVLWYASDGLRDEMGCLGPAQRRALKMILDKIADGSGVVDVDGSGR